MLRVLALGLPLAVFGALQSADPAVAACDCKYDANCPTAHFCKINVILCGTGATKGTCTPIVRVPQPDPVLKSPRTPPTSQGSGGMTAQ